MTPAERIGRHPSLPFSLWPQADKEGWQFAIRKLDPFERGEKRVSWRPRSKISAGTAYGRWLAWLLQQGVALDAEQPASRFTDERIRAYTTHLQIFCASVTVASYLGILCMVVVAAYPTHDWTWLRTVQAAFARRAKPSRNKAEEMVPAREAIRLGLDLMTAGRAVAGTGQSVATGDRVRLKAARDYRDGLLITFLAQEPLRVLNLLGMELGNHLLIMGDHVVIRFKASETKNKRAINSVWPTSLRSHLTHYLEVIRPMLMKANLPSRLCPSSTPALGMLWIGQGGTQLTGAGLKKALRRHTLIRFNKAIPAQRFRDIVATDKANLDPNNMEEAAQLLGHARFQTTQDNYIVPDSRVAMEHYHRLLEAEHEEAHVRTPGQTRKPRDAPS